MLLKNTIRGLALLLLALCQVNAASTLGLDGKTYVLRGQEGDAYRFAPQTQEKGAPKETLTLQYDAEVQSPEALMDFTDGFRDQFKESGQLIKAFKASNKEGEDLGFLVVGIQGDGGDHVANMTRTAQLDDAAVAIIYEKKFTGEDSQKEMIEWFQAHGRAMEAALLAYDPPAQKDLSKPE